MKNKRTSGGRQYDLSKKFRIHQQLPIHMEYPTSGETPSRTGSVLVQKSGHVDDDVQVSALDAFYEKDGRQSRYIGEVLERYREEDAGDLKRRESNESIG